MFKSAQIILMLAAVTLSSLAPIQSAEARRYRPSCKYPEYGYLPPNINGGPRVVFVPVLVQCTDYYYVVWKHCTVSRCW